MPKTGQSGQCLAQIAIFRRIVGSDFARGVHEDTRAGRIPWGGDLLARVNAII